MTDRKPEVTAEHREAAARVLDPLVSNAKGTLEGRIALAIAYAEQRGAKRASLDLGRADASKLLAAAKDLAKMVIENGYESALRRAAERILYLTKEAGDDAP